MSSEQQSDSVDPDESQDRSSSSRVSDKEQDPQTDDSADEGKTPTRPPQSSREEGSANPRSSRADFAAAEDNPRCQPNVQGASGQGGTSMAGPGSVESSSNSLFSMLQSRTIRRGLFVDPSRDNFRTMTNLYFSMSPAADSVNLSTQTHGAVFNLEYSPDGSVLTVACEQTEVLLFDPISSKHIKTLVEAHEDCVNNIRFLDNRLFATCSDDTTIALWDLRKLNSKVCSLHGHASWVKNIEYDTNTRLLVTSGFDGNVITWDTNRFTEDGCPHKKFFHTRYLMRMRLTPDCSKMLISTSSGYLLILHDLDLTQSLEVGSYRMLRARRTPLSSDGSASASRSSGAPRQGNDSSKIHPHREGLSPRNSLEVLTPEIPGERDRGNCITSLQLHPKGWAALIRCSSNMDDQEWTCVYEFQDGSPTRPPVSPRCSLRLTHYIEEANVGRGYIKELCFSPDGRLICSPYGYGVRLLSFDENCMELSDCLPVQTSCLREVRSIYSHSDVVLTTKFSPTHCQLASGCLSGRVALYQPRF
ncbi:DDB1- and CUL4-associated factor 10 isoform X2 [Salvelinus fontinalis]|uniref:DDB1- and CUL4-associated factor 10 n=1 Tax=Salvelinus namaycush TaxID=8040 RepID=A0A8U0QBS7_SALNM|nr:DDB1- and CUL4-associated factor 10 isoform X2 [Salvelinus namaycush]XP_055767058.1 DDB1- and CUL4-associated factor 10 isoform X2 [Salvelinus fontinalis]